MRTGLDSGTVQTQRCESCDAKPQRRQPTEAITGVRSEIELQPLVADIEAGENRSWADEAVADAQFSSRRSVDRSPAIFGAALERSGELREDAAFLRVPAKDGIEVDRVAMQVIELRIDFLKRKSLKEKDECFKFAVAEAVEFVRAKDDVEFAIAASVEIEMVLRKDAQAVNPRASVAKSRSVSNGGRRKSESVIQQRLRNAKRGIVREHSRSAAFDAVPVFQ